MGLRLNKRIKIVDGLTLNVGTSGTSWTLGSKGATVNIKNGKVRGRVSLPGTGLSYTTSNRTVKQANTQTLYGGYSNNVGWIDIIVYIVIFLVVIGIFI